MVAHFWRVVRVNVNVIELRHLVHAGLLIELHEPRVRDMQDLHDLLEQLKVAVAVVELVDERVKASIQRCLSLLLTSLFQVAFALELLLVKRLLLLFED